MSAGGAGAGGGAGGAGWAYADDISGVCAGDGAGAGADAGAAADTARGARQAGFEGQSAGGGQESRSDEHRSWICDGEGAGNADSGGGGGGVDFKRWAQAAADFGDLEALQAEGGLPCRTSFSFSRALENPVLEAWQAEADATQRARVAQATLLKYLDRYLAALK